MPQRRSPGGSTLQCVTNVLSSVFQFYQALAQQAMLMCNIDIFCPSIRLSHSTNTNNNNNKI